MSQYVIIANKNVIGLFSFSSGFVASPQPTLKSEDDILNHAHWLERHGHEDEALEFLERHCSRK